MALTEVQFSELALRELDAVSRLARALCRNTAEAEDLIQDTFLKAIRSRNTFTLTEVGMRPWLLRILRNTWINRANRSKLEPDLLQPDLLEQLPEVSADLAFEDWRASDTRLVQAIEGLPEALRTTILLWAIEDLSYKDIADVTSVPIGTVMSRLHRARRMLADRLGELASEHGIDRPASME